MGYNLSKSLQKCPSPLEFVSRDLCANGGPWPFCSQVYDGRDVVTRGPIIPKL